MPIPQEILAVERPKNTKVKKSGDRYLVIKRTCKRINGKNIPVDLGTIGEIIDFKYVEIREKPMRKNNVIDVKDYGLVQLFNKNCFDIYEDLSKVFVPDSAKKIYIIAMLRAIDNDIRNRDISFAYETSYISEIFKNVSLSENTISSFLMKTGMEYRYIQEFITNRVKKFENNTQIIDGTLIDNNSTENTYSEPSRKSRVKGTNDITLVYSYDVSSKEPIAMKTYPGNMLDSTSINDFMNTYPINKGLIVLDKGFYTKDNIKRFKETEGLSFIIPLKTNAKLLTDNNGYDNINKHLKGYDEESVLYNKIKVDDETYLYAYKNLKSAYEQQVGYIANKEKKGKYDGEDYDDKTKEFGVIVFESNKDMDPLEIYLAYMKRWEIETMFQLMKGIIDLDTVNVHSDYSVTATEFINFLSVIMAQRIKQVFQNTYLPPVNKKSKPKSIADTYSFKQTIKYISKIKKVRVGNSDKWVTNQTLKYITELSKALGI